MINIKSLTVSLISLACLPSIGFAFFCPTNFNQIDFGMSPDQVTQACGKPDKQTESTQENENVPQEWSYYVKQNVAAGTGNRLNTSQGTLKSSVTFDASGKAINISVNGIGVGATELCGKKIKLGDTRDNIRAACGDPAFLNKQTSPTGAGTPAAPSANKIIEFEYSSANPPATLVFENGVLTSKK